MYGYAGRQLIVDLGKKEIKKTELKEEIMKKYLGGVGYAVRYLYDEMKGNIDPLGPENILIFATSPLTMNNIPGGGSVELCYKSPLTGGWGESRCGGDFGPMMRKAGYDFIIIKGRADRPVYLEINTEGVTINNAEDLKGKTVSEKIALLKEKLNDDYEIMCIGPGGENLVKYATVMSGNRAAGRTGAGAVMGARNLLAVAVSGNKQIDVYDKTRLMNKIRDAMKIIRESPDAEAYSKHGTTGDLPSNDENGDWPTKNWQSNSWGKGNELYNYFYKNNLIKNITCYSGCPVACGRYVEVKEGEYRTPAHEGAEYESISAFTAFVLNEDVNVAVYSTYLCNELGIDTISAGGAIAFAMECYEKGLLNEFNLDNINLNWGNSEVLPELVRMISNREGIGDLLADGVKIASERIGGDAYKYAIHVKGLEGPAHDPRSGKALALAYGTGNRGMCHIHPVEAMAYDSGKMDFGLQKFGLTDPEKYDRWDETGKGKELKILQDGLLIPDIITTCKFMMYFGITLDDYAEMLSAITGWDIDGWELLTIGERVNNLERLFNIREGFTVKDDMIPERVKQEPEFGKYHGINECSIKNYEGMLQEYYQARDWNYETGRPSDLKLKELDLM
jgi:aldehyde:ferredoxin oxidoreductase